MKQLSLRWIGLVLGPVSAVGLYFVLPDQFLNANAETVLFTHQARATAAVAAWMAVWWMTEAIPIPATALLPLAVLPLLNVLSIKKAAAPYGHDLIFLFMGGFILALAMERWNLHKRMAFFALRFVGTDPSSIIAGFMIITAFLSMWISNTATTILMLPMALSLIDLFETKEKDRSSFSLCLLLGIAYSASIGGVGTLIGTPPNLFLASYVKSYLNTDISFVKWMGVGVPLVIVFLPIVWFVLTRFLFPLKGTVLAGTQHLAQERYKNLGPMSRGEKITLVVFTLTALMWMLRPVLSNLEWGGDKPLKGLSDSGIAMLAALSLFVIPVQPKIKVFVMDWETAVKLPWGLLILFGGGLSLAAAIQANGIGEMLAAQVSHWAAFPSFVIVFLVVTLIVYLTTFTSNTASAAAFIPILALMAPGLGLHPYYLIIPTAIAASCAFMLPVSTPPNAIVFGSGKLTIPQMVRAGFWLTNIGIVLITLLTYAIALPLFLP